MTNERSESPKVRAIREAWQREHPESGGSPSLSLPETLKVQVMAAGEAGILLADLRRSMGMTGREKREDALRQLRNDDAVEESRERRPDAKGNTRLQVVFRLRS